MKNIIKIAVLFIFITILVLPAGAEAENAPKPVIYLTFDDGPSKITGEVLDILKENGIKATFFVIKKEDEELYSYYSRIINEGHSLGLHTCSHDFNKIYKSAESFLNEIEAEAAWIKSEFGYTSGIIRFPGGSSSMHLKKEIGDLIKNSLKIKGYMWYDWDIDPHDSGGSASNAGDIVQSVIAQAKKMGDKDIIILLHDDPIRKTLPQALPKIIAHFKSNGYEFKGLAGAGDNL